jgi:hypothetical protein
MRSRSVTLRLAVAALLLLAAPVSAKSATPGAVDSSSWVDHDGQPVKRPKQYEHRSTRTSSTRA